jgi:hypothetical protein
LENFIATKIRRNFTIVKTVSSIFLSVCEVPLMKPPDKPEPQWVTRQQSLEELIKEAKKMSPEEKARRGRTS